MYRLTSRFKRDERGAIAIISALTVILLCACVGGAIDFARYSSAKSATSAALDTAVLAGARTLLLTGSPGQAKAVAQKYYEENVANRYAVDSDTVAFSVTDGGSTVTGSGNAYLPTTLLKLVGIERLPLVAAPAAGFPKATISGGGGGNIEVSVMLDVTGSMCNDGVGPCTTGTKIDALKTAAKDLVNIVVMDDQSQFKSRVALVPFAQKIRVAPDGQGAALMKSMTNLEATWSGWRQTCTNWTVTGTVITENGTSDTISCDTYQTEQITNWKIRPCVTERFYDNSWVMDFTDDAPGNNAWLNAETGRRFPISRDSASTPFTSGLGQTESDPADGDYWSYAQDGDCNEPESNQVMRLSSDKSALVSHIDGLTGKAATGGALGTAFTWYMLSPNWNSVWAGDSASDADPYAHLTIIQSNGKPKLRKVAILLSDGVYNTRRGWDNQNQQDISNDAKSVCTAMKAKGIEIYAVGFDLNSLSSSERVIAEDTLKSCGTSLEHFYNTLDPAELQSAFRDIAVKLSTIALTH